MAEKNVYIKEAYDTLLKLSANDQKRLEYDAREKAIRDYEAALSYARKEGEQIGKEIGEKTAARIISLHSREATSQVDALARIFGGAGCPVDIRLAPTEAKRRCREGQIPRCLHRGI